MATNLMPITAVAKAVGAERPEAIEAAVRAAYEAGVTRDTLLMAVDVARGVAGASAPVAAHAYAAVHRWSWIWARRIAPRGEVVPQAA